MKFCPVCDRQFEQGELCPDDGAMLMNLPENKPDPLIGVTLKGSYRVEEKIGEGGMGSVYRATQQPLGRAVAIKILHNNELDSTQSIKRFYREAKTLSRLSHPNIVGLIDFGNTEEGLFFLVMEMLKGETLFDAVPETLPWSPRRVADIFSQICAGVGAAHKSGLIHRDLKPSNIFIGKNSDDSETVKVLDFGIAKVHDDDSVSRLTQTGSVVGTIGYIAPEVMTGEKPASPQSDIYSLGALLYLALTGNTAYDGPSTRSIILKQIKEPPAIPDLGPFGYSEHFANVVRKAMAIDPQHRYDSTNELAQAINEAASMPVESIAANASPMPRSVMMDLGSKVMEVDTSAETAIELLPEERATTTHIDEADNLHTGQLSTLPSADKTAQKPVQREAKNTAITNRADNNHQNTQGSDTSSPNSENNAGSHWPAQKKSAAGPIAGLVIIVILALLTWLSWKSGLLPGSQIEVDDKAQTAALAPDNDNKTKNSVPKLRQNTPALSVGVDDKQIFLGISSASSGPTKDLGIGIWHGIEARLQEQNSKGGVHGRKLKIIHLDDGYEPERAKANVKSLLDANKVFAFIGDMGTPTAAATLPLIQDAQKLLFGALSGAKFLEKNPPDRYVFNFRPRYSEELAPLLDYLVKVRGIKPYQISAFIQDDAYGEDGLQAIIKSLRRLGYKKADDVFVARYARNSEAIKAAALKLYKNRALTKAVVMVATSQPAAQLIIELRKRHMPVILSGVSAIANPDFAPTIMAANPEYLKGVIITQVVPDPMSHASGVSRFRKSFSAAYPDETPSPAALEGYISTSIFIDALQRTGKNLTTERLIDTLEHSKNLDLGFGAVCHFAPSVHQCSHKVWATVLDEEGRFNSLDLE